MEPMEQASHSEIGTSTTSTRLIGHFHPLHEKEEIHLVFQKWLPNDVTCRDVLLCLTSYFGLASARDRLQKLGFVKISGYLGQMSVFHQGEDNP
jgi:hypothetical protein